MTDLEKQLIKICKEELEVDSIHLDDNLSDIGDSLRIVLLLTRIEKDFNTQISLDTLIYDSSIGKIATLLEDQNTQIRGYGKDTSRFLLFYPTPKGNSLLYYKLNDLLNPSKGGPELRATRTTIQWSNRSRIEEIAQDYIHQIRLLQPTGPYFLWSKECGSTMCMAVAQGLQAQGEKITFFVSIDGQAPNIHSSLLTRLLSRTIQYLRTGEFRWLLAKLKDIRKNSLAIVSQKRRYVRSPNSQGSEYDYTFVTQQFNLKRKYRGDVHLFFSGRFSNSHLGKVAGLEWKHIVDGNIDLQVVDSTSSPNMFKEPNLQLLVSKLNSALKNTQNRLQSSNLDQGT